MPDRGALRLLVVGSCDRETGGIAQYIRGQVSHLSDEVDVTVHSTSSPQGKSAVSAGRGPKYRWLARAVLSAVWTFLHYPFHERPDVVHVHSSSRLSFYRESVYVVYAALVWRCPVVLHVHGSDFDSFLQECGPVRSWYARWVFDRCQSVVVLSPYWADVLREVGVDHTTVIPNPVDAEAFPDGDGAGEPHILYVSSLIERKGIREFTEAIRRLARRQGSVPAVTIAGDGPEADCVTSLAADIDSVEYLGYVSEQHKRELLAEGSIYVLPTYAEGLPIALLEGMAGGNAVVSTSVGAIPDVVGSENGILIPPVDVEKLVAALETLRTDDQLRRDMASHNRETVRTEYTWDRVTEELLALYGAVLDDGRGGADEPPGVAVTGRP